jgi:hypothetical protein
MRAQTLRIFDLLHIRHLVAIGCTGLYWDPHTWPQIQVESALKQAKMWLNDRFIIWTAPTREQSSCIFDRLYKTHDCYGVYGLVFRSPCASSNTSGIYTETSDNVTNDCFIVRTAPLREQSLRISDRLYIRQMFAYGCTGKYLDFHAQPQIQQLQFALKQDKCLLWRVRASI